MSGEQTQYGLSLALSLQQQVPDDMTDKIRDCRRHTKKFLKILRRFDLMCWNDGNQKTTQMKQADRG
jgi:hypothetical protein